MKINITNPDGLLELLLEHGALNHDEIESYQTTYGCCIDDGDKAVLLGKLIDKLTNTTMIGEYFKEETP